MVGAPLIRIYLTGRMAIEGSAIVDEADLPGSQGRILLAVLALGRGPISRTGIANILWDGDPPAAFDRSLNPLLSKLRAAMIDVGAHRDQIVAATGTVELRRGPGLRVDVEEATRALDAAEGRLRRGEYSRAWTQAAVATSIFGRGFLEGIESRWVEDQRRNLAAQSVRAYEVVTDVWLGLGDASQAVVSAERLVAADPFRETSHTRLIRAHLAGGNRARALQAFAECERLLREELGVAPSAAVQAAYEAALSSP